MARKNADTNSDSRSERAVALILTLIATSFRVQPSQQHRRHGVPHATRGVLGGARQRSLFSNAISHADHAAADGGALEARRVPAGGGGVVRVIPAAGAAPG